MSSFAVYAIGILVLVAGLAYVANLMHIHTQWIVAMVVLVAGAGLIGAASTTKKPE